MKAIYSTMILSCALLASCTSDELVSESAIGGQGIKVTASFANHSRTTYEVGDGVVKTLWEAGDAIGLTYEEGTEAQNNLKYTANTAGATTVFSKAEEALTAPEGATVFAYYPYKASSEGTSTTLQNYTQGWNGSNKVSVSVNEQGYTDANTVPLDLVYASGVVKDGALTLDNFKHAYAFIQLTVSKEVLHYDSNKEHYQIELESTGSLSTFYEHAYDIKNGVFGNLSGAYPMQWVKYFVPKTAFDDTDEITCYIAVLPTDQAGMTINIHKQAMQSTGINIIASGTTPEGGLKAGVVYPLKAKLKPTADELALEGTYDFSAIDYKSEEEVTGTVELIAAGDHTFTMKGMPGKADASITLEYSVVEGKGRLTMRPDQFLYDYYDTPVTLRFANEELSYASSAMGGSIYSGEVTVDPSVTYIANQEDEGGRPKFAFTDGGTWAGYQVAAIAYMYTYMGVDSVEGGAYSNLVLTRQSDAVDVEDVDGSQIEDMKDNQW